MGWIGCGGEGFFDGRVRGIVGEELDNLDFHTVLDVVNAAVEGGEPVLQLLQQRAHVGGWRFVQDRPLAVVGLGDIGAPCSVRGSFLPNAVGGVVLRSLGVVSLSLLSRGGGVCGMRVFGRHLGDATMAMLVLEDVFDEADIRTY